MLTVTPQGSGALLTDHVTIDAGLSTLVMTYWARFVYGRRHKPRLRMLGLTRATSAAIFAKIASSQILEEFAPQP